VQMGSMFQPAVETVSFASRTRCVLLPLGLWRQTLGFRKHTGVQRRTRRNSRNLRGAGLRVWPTPGIPCGRRRSTIRKSQTA